MKNIIRKALFLLVTVLIIAGCGLTKKQKSKTDLPLTTSMKITCNIENGKMYQIDSLIIVDTLPNLNKWLHSVYVDYSTNKKITKRMYIKMHSNNTETVYIITGTEEPYKIIKRITE